MKPETVHFVQAYGGTYRPGTIYSAYSYQVVYDSDKRIGARMEQPADTIPTLSDIKVYPNPTTGMLNFAFPLAKQTEIGMMDMTGKVLARKTVYKSSATTINVDGFVPGTYLYQVTSDKLEQSGKVVVEK